MANDTVTRATDELGHRALALMDKLLAERPEKVGHEFSEATRCLCEFRDALIAKVRAGGAREPLDSVNAVLSVVFAGHFPLGGVPWSKLEEARKRLAEAVDTTRP